MVELVKGGPPVGPGEEAFIYPTLALGDEENENEDFLAGMYVGQIQGILMKFMMEGLDFSGLPPLPANATSKRTLEKIVSLFRCTVLFEDDDEEAGMIFCTFARKRDTLRAV